MMYKITHLFSNIGPHFTSLDRFFMQYVVHCNMFEQARVLKVTY